MPIGSDSLSVDGLALWNFREGESGPPDRAARNVQVFKWLEAGQAEVASTAVEVDAEIAVELRRLDAKLSMILDLLLDRSGLTAETGATRSMQPYVLTAEGVELDPRQSGCIATPAIGACGVLEWHPDPRLPSVLTFDARVTSTVGYTTRFDFLQIGESERDCLERWIFREHRRARERYR